MIRFLLGPNDICLYNQIKVSNIKTRGAILILLLKIICAYKAGLYIHTYITYLHIYIINYVHNCNAMITEPVDHGLHVILSRELISSGLHMTYQLHPSIYIISALNSSLHRRIVATTSSPLYRLGHRSALALSRVEVLRITDYLQTNAFSDLVMIEQEEYSHTL